MATYFLGIDWADASFHVCVLDEAGQQVLNKQVSHQVEDLAEFGRWLLEQHQANIRLCATIEKPEGRVVDFLLDHQVEVYPVNPKALDRARDRHRASRSKSDPFDAFVLADFLRTDRGSLSVLAPNSPQAAELKVMTRDYGRLVRQQTRLLNQLTAALKEYYPRPIEVFDDLTTEIFMDFLEAYPTPDALRRLTRQQWQRFGKAHRMPATQVQQRWEALQAPQVGVPPFITRAKGKLVEVLVGQLRVTVKAVADYREEIARFFASMPEAQLTQAMPGGPSGMMLPAVLAEMGDGPGRWQSFQHLQAVGGTTPFTRQSGKGRGAFFRVACNRRLRYAITWYAYASLRQCEWARAYYDHQRARGHGHYQALRALGAKWLKILFVVRRDQVPYDETRHLANIARQNLRQALFS